MLSGLIYLQAGTAPDLPSANPGSGPFAVTRAYLNLGGQWAPGLTSRLTLDGAKASSTRPFALLKYAYAEGPLPGLDAQFRVGRVPLPWVAYEEALWGYRMQGTAFAERNGLSVSADWGGSLMGRAAGGDYALGVFEGGRSAGIPTTEGRWTRSTWGGGKAGAVASFGAGRYNTLGLLASWEAAQGELGGELVRLQVPAGAPGLGVTTFGILKPGYWLQGLERLHVLGRLDGTRGDLADPSSSEVRAIAGLAWQAAAGVTLMVDAEGLLSGNPAIPPGGGVLGHTEVVF